MKGVFLWTGLKSGLPISQVVSPSREHFSPVQGLASREDSEVLFALGPRFSFPGTSHRRPAIAGTCPQGNRVPPSVSPPNCDFLFNWRSNGWPLLQVNPAMHEKVYFILD